MFGTVLFGVKKTKRIKPAIRKRCLVIIKITKLSARSHET